MKVRIHRGTQQIGGTCIEVATDHHEARLVLDLGRPLDVNDAEARASVPDVDGLVEGGAGLLAVLISHPHQDHVGLVEFVHDSIPIGIGPAAQRVLDRTSKWLGKPSLADRHVIHFSSGKAITIGPFVVTPYLVDHSAYDAYALLVEADGERLFYSGDFRGHGRKAGLFEKLLTHPPRDIDVLLMEGTVIGRDGSGDPFPTESELEERFAERFAAAEGTSLVWTSAQNIDRLVTLYRAALRTGKRLVLDAFTAEMLAATENAKLPQADWDKVIGVYIPRWMQLSIKRREAFGELDRFRKNRVYLEDLTAGDVMLFRAGLLREVAAKMPLTGAQMLYSNWSGYLSDGSTQAVRDWLRTNGIPLHQIHTSGHASVPDLIRSAGALAPKRLVPIHSFHGDSFAHLFENVDRRSDGECWEVTNNKEIAMTEGPALPQRESKYTIKELLERMAKFANQRANHRPVQLAENFRYVRVGGDGMLPVSLKMENACGGLPGLKGKAKFEALEKVEAWLEKHESEAHDVAAKRLPSIEHRLQAYLIKNAILDSPRVLRELHLQEEFTAIRLITDELSLRPKGEKGLRMDMVFLVEQHGRWRPLFVELKIEHKTGNDSPFSQLDAACTMVADQPEELRAFLSAASGRQGVPQIPETLIDVAIPRRLAVLPYLTPRSKMESLWGCHGANRDLVRTFCSKLVGT